MLGRQTGAIHLGQPVNWASPLNRGLVSWWMAIPQGAYFGGARLLDLAGKNHGTLTNGPTWGGSLGRHGGLGRLQFGSGSNVNFGNPASIKALTSAITVSVWVRPTVTTRTDYFGQWGGTDQHFLLTSGITGSRFGFYVSETGSGSQNATTGANFSVNTWYHVTCTYDRATIRIYQDGIQSGTNAQTFAMYTGSNADVRAGISGDDTAFAGSLDSIRIYDRALNADDVWKLYNEERRGYPTTLNRIRLPLVNSAAGGGGSTVPVLDQGMLTGGLSTLGGGLI